MVQRSGQQFFGVDVGLVDSQHSTRECVCGCSVAAIDGADGTIE